MEITGEYLIPRERQVVWDALNDPAVLKACIPGCQELTPTEQGEGFDAKVLAKIGPVKATFRGGVTLKDINEARSYTLVGEGKGGAAGFAKFTSAVQLDDTEGGTRLSYDANAQLGGKLAQLGARMIEGTARKYADEFFGKFSETVAPEAAEQGAAEDANEAAAAPSGESEQGGRSRWPIIAAAIVIAAAIAAAVAL